MPKEIINYPSYVEHHPLALAAGIHWSENDSDQGPQMSVQFNVEDMHRFLTKLREDSPMDKRTIVYTEPLTRAEMQRLIRSGRRARDAAYGADE